MGNHKFEEMQHFKKGFELQVGVTAVAVVAAFPLLCITSEVIFGTTNSILLRLTRSLACLFFATMIWRGSRIFRIGTAILSFAISLLTFAVFLLVALFNPNGQDARTANAVFMVYLAFMGVLLLLPPVARFQTLQVQRRRRKAIDTEP